MAEDTDDDEPNYALWAALVALVGAVILAVGLVAVLFFAGFGL